MNARGLHILDPLSSEYGIYKTVKAAYGRGVHLILVYVVYLVIFDSGKVRQSRPDYGRGVDSILVYVTYLVTHDAG